MEQLKQQLVVLAALLHDIGKFAQRAGAPCNENLAQEYCPGGEPHRYVLYTDYFIEQHLPLPPELEPFRSKIARMASTYHRADSASREELCIQEANRLSAGNNRNKGESNGTMHNASCMENIFSQVHLRLHDLEDTPRRYKLQALDADDAPIFPVGQAEAQKTTYKELYAAFLAALKEWEHGSPCSMGVEHFLHSLQTALERFTWCIPSSMNPRADVSLFDHGSTTAAIAQALYHGEKEDSELCQTPLMLLGGELSGIQNFIFGQGEQGDRGASKLLRARSFSLQMLTRSIWLVLLERCGLNSTARIMDAGGRFILLLPNTPSVRTAVEEVTEQAIKYVLEYFNGVLRVTFASQELKAEDLNMDKFHIVFQQMNDELEREKLRPFSPLLENGFSPIIGIKSSDYAEHGPCPYCGLRPAESEDEGCRICSALIQQIGRTLPEARYALFSRSGTGFPLFDGLRLRLEKDVPSPTDAKALDILNLKNRRFFSAAPVAGYVPRMTQADVQRWKAEKRPLTKDEDAQEVNAPKTFGTLAEEARIPTENGFRSVPFLAACKADVDNLGLIFGIGLESGGTSRFSISHFAMLSRMMHHFFSSYLINVIEKEFPNIYVVFAGGDDLFVIGPWNETVRFAERLYNAFSDFTGKNQDVTLSAGVALVKPGLPMRAIKDLAEHALEASKGRSNKDKNDKRDTPGNSFAKHDVEEATGKNEKNDVSAKNAVTLFGVTCPWAKFSSQLEKGEWLEKLCLSGNITQGFVRRLLGYSRQAGKFSSGDLNAGLYRSHMVYDMARNCSKNMKEGDTDSLQALCHSKDFNQMEISITWALYRTRTTA